MPENYVGPKKGSYRFEKPYQYFQTRWGKIRYKAMYFSRSQQPSLGAMFKMQDQGYLTQLEYSAVFVPAYKNVQGKKPKRDGFEKMGAWVVYGRKMTKEQE